MTYSEAMAYIASLEGRGWRLGLDRMQEFVKRAGLNDSIGGPAGPQYIHVAGTNGKGSTTAFLQSMLVASGYRTGGFFSPFVVDPRERVQFNGNLIGKQELADVTAKLMPIADCFSEKDFGEITEFEFKTALGFEYWKQRNCDWVALEVGLGGRLDATTVVTPRATVIVSIGLDHMNILGDTLAKIAYEKAGIIKPGVPLIVGEMPQEAEEVILQIAERNKALVWRWGREVVWHEGSSSVETPLTAHKKMMPGIFGSKQNHNMALAVAAIDAAGAFKSEEALKTGAEKTTLPGRFQQIEYKGRTVIFDGAHNPDSAAVLKESLKARFGPGRYVLVTNMLSGHEPKTFYEILKDRVSCVHVVPVDFHRATPVHEMVDTLKSLFTHVVGHESTITGLDSALSDAGNDDIILVTGTFYLAGELLRQLEY